MIYYKNKLCYKLIIIMSSAAFILSSCKLDETDIKIERFEYMDIYKRNQNKENNLNKILSSQAYLIHGYQQRHEKEINDLVDRYFCDSLMQKAIFNKVNYITLYKKSENTNRESFQSKAIENKKDRARGEDKLFKYIFTYNKDSTLFRITKYWYGLSEPDPPPQTFNCK